MQVTVTDFKAHCTEYLREIANKHDDIYITKRGKIIAVVTEPKPKDSRNPLYGSLKGSLLHIADDFDEPLGESDWEASQ